MAIVDDNERIGKILKLSSLNDDIACTYKCRPKVNCFHERRR